MWPKIHSFWYLFTQCLLEVKSKRDIISVTWLLYFLDLHPNPPLHVSDWKIMFELLGTQSSNPAMLFSFIQVVITVIISDSNNCRTIQDFLLVLFIFTIIFWSFPHIKYHYPIFQVPSPYNDLALIDVPIYRPHTVQAFCLCLFGA